MHYNGAAVKVEQDFTDDRDKLQKAIDDLIPTEGLGFDETDSSAAAADTAIRVRPGR